MAMSKPVMISSDAANAMLDIYSASLRVPQGVPVAVPNATAANELERAGLIERHHIGYSKRVGAIVTSLGKKFVSDAVRHLRAHPKDQE